MGTIRVGKSNPQAFLSDGYAASSGSAVRKDFSEEEKAKLIESIRKMPKDKWVSALRSVGLDNEANECERSLAEEHLLEMRKKRLAEIMAMDEDDQLSLLIEEGFDDEAKALSEKLSAENIGDGDLAQIKEDEGNGELNVAQEEAVGGDLSELKEDESEKVEKPKKRTYTRRKSNK